MATAYTSLLGLALPVTGELQGTWGTTVNDSITSLLDTAVAGTTTLSADTDVTLSTTTGAANQARQAILLCSGARTVLRTITAPAQSKIYTVINATTGGFSVKLVGVGPTTGVTIVAGESALVAWNGSDFIKISNTGGAASFTNVTVSGTTTLSGLTASTALALNGSKEVVSVTNTGTGNNVLSASPTLTGTISAAAATLSGNLTLSGGTANGVLYLDGSKVATSGTALAFNGTSLLVGKNSSDANNWGVQNYATNAFGSGMQLTYGGVGSAGLWVPAASSLAFGADAGSGTTELMRLTSTGLGIGTSSPATKLQVSGTGSQEIRISTLTSGSPRLGLNAEGSNGGAITYDRATSAFVISNGGVDRATLDLSGNLGIGTSSPGYKLDVVGVGKSSSAFAIGDSSGNLSGTFTNESDVSKSVTFNADPANVGANSFMRWNVDGSERMRLDSSGNLGLGVTPSAWINVGKAIEIGDVGTGIWGRPLISDYVTNTYFSATGYRYALNGAAARYTVSGGEHSWHTAPSGTAGNAISFTQAMTLDASGNLGIGTSTTTNGRLNVQAGTAATGNSAFFTNFDGTYNTYLQIQHSSDGVKLFNGNSFGAAANNLIFGNTGTAETMRIDSSGNLGIGTSSPSVRLQLEQAANSAPVTLLRLNNSGTTGGGPGIASRISFTAGATALGYVQGSNFASGAAGLQFSGDGTNAQATLDSSGNLGLGVTPSAWATSAFQTKVASVWGFNNNAYVGCNYYFDGTDRRYIATASASEYAQFNGQHTWYTAPSGTAGNAISFTQAMTLDASGRLGIGETSPSQKLDIAGNGQQWIKINNNNNAGANSIAGIQLWANNSYRSALYYNDNAGTTYLDTTAGSSQALSLLSGSTLSLSAAGANVITFSTNATERARITSGGYFKASNNGAYFGGTGSYHEFRSSVDEFTQRNSNTNATTPYGYYIQYTAAAPNGTGSQFLYCEDNVALRAEIRSNGGLANYSGNDVNLSDRREKTNFAPAKSYLDTICAIPVQTFNYIDQSEDDPGLTLGVVAQDVQAVAPELVMESNWGTEDNPKMRLSIYQTDLQYALMKCIQELKAQNDELRARVAALEAA